MPAARRQRTGVMDPHGQFRLNEMRGRENPEPLPEGYTGNQPVKEAPQRGPQMTFNPPEYKCPDLPKVKAKAKRKTRK